MKRRLNFAVAGLFVLLNAWMLFQSLGYFRQNPANLIYVSGIVLVAGAALSFYSLLSFSWRKRLQLMIYSSLTSGFAVGGVSMAALIWKCWQLLPPLSFLPQSEVFALLSTGSLLLLLVVVCGVESLRFGKQLFFTLKENESHTIQ